MSSVDEYLDLVDENDIVVGKKKRSDVYAEGLSNFRVVNVFIRNSKGELWIPRRAANKRIFPLALDMSMGGHVDSGETYDEAFRRETEEELRMDMQLIPYRLLGHLTPHHDHVAAFMNVYEITMDDVPPYDPNEFTEWFWMTPAEVLKQVENGEKAKDDLSKLLKIFYLPS